MPHSQVLQPLELGEYGGKSAGEAVIGEDAAERRATGRRGGREGGSRVTGRWATRREARHKWAQMGTEEMDDDTHRWRRTGRGVALANQGGGKRAENNSRGLTDRKGTQTAGQAAR